MGLPGMASLAQLLEQSASGILIYAPGRCSAFVWASLRVKCLVRILPLLVSA